MGRAIKSRADLKASNEPAEILIGMATCGIAAGAGDTLQAIQEELAAQNLTAIKVVAVGCIGYCYSEPLVQINLPGERPVLYGNVDPEKGRQLVKALTTKQLPAVETLAMDFERVMLAAESATVTQPTSAKKQYRIALRNCGLINPDNIDEYIACHGYQALGRVLTTITPEAVIAAIKSSGLRGRGGGGFPTGLKWEYTRNSPTQGEKYIFCNADEGDPGAFMDRSILEGDPHSVLEAMAIGGFAIGAGQGIIYIRAEYPLAIKRLKTAIDQATEYGFLGQNIFDSGFNFTIELRYGAGAFVCGEETALINSAEGRRGEPKNKPPFPAVERLLGPTDLCQ